MNIYLVLLTLYGLCFVQPSPSRMGRSGSHISETRQAASIQGITKEKAIAIAKRHALRRYKSVERFKVVACELTIFWRIIFDGGGPEYVIDKKSGVIRRVQTIPEAWVGHSEESSRVSPELSREEAIEIAKRDTIESIPGTDMDHFTISACELQKVWRVFVEFKLHFEPGAKDPILPHSSAPNYVIDKKTGKVLFQQRYGSAKR